jgi:hypothetical protein
MALTKMHDWDTGTDGAIPMTSTRCAGLNEVRLTDDDGEWFGWEDPGSGKLFRGTRIVNSTAKQALIDAENTVLQTAIAAAISRDSDIAALKAKRDAGTPLTDVDHELIADLITGRI